MGNGQPTGIEPSRTEKRKSSDKGRDQAMRRAYWRSLKAKRRGFVSALAC